MNCGFQTPLSLSLISAANSLFRRVSEATQAKCLTCALPRLLAPSYPPAHSIKGIDNFSLASPPSLPLSPTRGDNTSSTHKKTIVVRTVSSDWSTYTYTPRPPFRNHAIELRNMCLGPDWQTDATLW